MWYSIIRALKGFGYDKPVSYFSHIGDKVTVVFKDKTKVELSFSAKGNTRTIGLLSATSN